MKILLFNDNPVVRKLVALSAQKTKDDLSVISSVDEIEESEYDLLIVDDALYSNDAFEGIKEHTRFKTALLMSTRGNAVPAGFENVINKPFLPTDLVDMFVQIDKKLSSSTIDIKEEFPEDLFGEEESDFAEATLDALPSLDDGIDLEEFETLEGMEHLEEHAEEESLPMTNILDEEEVQEVRGLLEDTESDELADTLADFHEESGLEEAAAVADEPLELNEAEWGEEFASAPLEALTPEEEPALEPKEDEFDFATLDLGDLGGEDLDAFGEETTSEALLPMEEEAEMLGFEEAQAADEAPLDILDEELAGLEEMPDMGEDLLLPAEEEAPLDILDEELAGLEEMPDMGEDLLLPTEEEPSLEEELDLGDFADDFPEEEAIGEADFSAFEEEEEAAENAPISSVDDELGELELQIQEAVDELEPEDLELELDQAVLDELAGETAKEDEGVEGFDEFDSLNELELKKAIGEETDEVRVGSGELAALNLEALDEAKEMTEAQESAPDASQASPVEGVEALQALLKALANEEVAKSLKGLNISININFGNDK